MGYIERNLLDDEKIVYRTQKHPIIFLVPVLWTVVMVVCLVNVNPWVNKFAIAPGIAAAATWFKQFLNFATAVFVVTNKRILMKEGFFFRHMNDLRLSTISNISVSQSLLGQLLDYGTLLINPFGGENDLFPEIAHPNEFKRQAQMQLENKKVELPIKNN